MSNGADTRTVSPGRQAHLWGGGESQHDTPEAAAYHAVPDSLLRALRQNTSVLHELAVRYGAGICLRRLHGGPRGPRWNPWGLSRPGRCGDGTARTGAASRCAAQHEERGCRSGGRL